MEQFDEKMRLRAVREDCPAPDGFYGRLQETLSELPPQKKRRRLGGVKGALVAAAACVLLVGTAFAASPALRNLLAEALGGFAPYAQTQESDVYRWNGFEIKVLSAMADETTIQVYAQVTDLEGRDRLEFCTEAYKNECPSFSLGGLKEREEITSYCGGDGVASYDKATQTAIVVASNIGIITDDLSGARFKVDTVKHWLDDPWNPPVSIPLDVKIMPSKTVVRNIEAAGLQVDEVRVSALTLTVEWKKTSMYFEGGDLMGKRVSVEMKDGTVVGTRYDFSDGNASYIDSDTGEEHAMMIWIFADPVEADQVAGVHIGDDYFPVR